MWKLSEIHIRNIVSFREAELMIEQGVATLIFGKNEDNASQPCNGSGKSSLIEAISFALTGEQLRKVKTVEEIINDQADEAYVLLKLDNDYDNTVLIIERTIRRNAPQVIECHKFNSDGQEIEQDKTIQPTVMDYNRFILSEIGLSKDDIYNNFILCDNKYEGFFDCSDKAKKEIINRFSNGVIIDESIARLQADMEPVKESLSEAEKQVVSLKGAISAIGSELAGVAEKKANAIQERQTRIANLDDKILQTRQSIEDIQSKQERAENRLTNLIALQKEIEEMEGVEESVNESFAVIRDMCKMHELGEITDFSELAGKYNTQLTQKAEQVISIKTSIAAHQRQLQKIQKAYAEGMAFLEQQAKKYDLLNQEDEKSAATIKIELKKIDDQLDEIDAKLRANKARQSELSVLIAQNSALMNGVIICPKCSHKFFPDTEVTVDSVRETLIKLRTETSEKEEEAKSLNRTFTDLDDAGASKEEELNELLGGIKKRNDLHHQDTLEWDPIKQKISELEVEISKTQRDLASTEADMERLQGRIESLRSRMFGEINGMLEGRVLNGKNYLEQLESNITFAKGQLAQYRAARKELVDAPDTDFEASLTKSLNKYQDDLEAAEKTASEIKTQYDILKTQEVNFTMFKSYIARKKIDALSYIVNDFLEKIGSDIRLKLEGYTVTKTGKLRDKISVQVMRDGIDCGSYHKFSGGEKARLNLACILSLHSLTNSNCEDGKGLDFIIVDELLDKSDEVGIATYCEALNKLGQTALLITQGGVAEGYPHRLSIVKKQGFSTIN